MGIEIGNSISPAYEILARKRENLSPCYAPYYIRLLGDYLGLKPVVFVLTEKHAPIGALVLFVKDGPAGKVANSMPYFGSYGGCVVDPSLSRERQREVKAKILSLMLQWADKEAIRLVTVINHPFEEDKDIYETTLSPEFQDERIGQVLELPKTSNPEDALDHLLKIHRKGRNVVRKGIRLTEVKVENTIHAFQFLYSTHVQNISAIGGLAKEWSFFELVNRTLTTGRDYVLYLGYVEGKRAAACLTFRFGNVIDYFTPAIDHDFRSTQALSGVIIRAMQDGAINGFRWWNWGGTWYSQEGVYRFKARWGGEDKPYVYHIKVLGNLDKFKALGKAGLLSSYPHFYTLPFSKAGLD